MNQLTEDIYKMLTEEENNGQEMELRRTITCPCGKCTPIQGATRIWCTRGLVPVSSTREWREQEQNREQYNMNSPPMEQLSLIGNTTTNCYEQPDRNKSNSRHLTSFSLYNFRFPLEQAQHNQNKIKELSQLPHLLMPPPPSPSVKSGVETLTIEGQGRVYGGVKDPSHLSNSLIGPRPPTPPSKSPNVTNSIETLTDSGVWQVRQQTGDEVTDLLLRLKEIRSMQMGK